MAAFAPTAFGFPALWRLLPLCSAPSVLYKLSRLFYATFYPATVSFSLPLCENVRLNGVGFEGGALQHACNICSGRLRAAAYAYVRACRYALLPVARCLPATHRAALDRTVPPSVGLRQAVGACCCFLLPAFHVERFPLDRLLCCLRGFLLHLYCSALFLPVCCAGWRSTARACRCWVSFLPYSRGNADAKRGLRCWTCTARGLFWHMGRRANVLGRRVNVALDARGEGCCARNAGATTAAEGTRGGGTAPRGAAFSSFSFPSALNGRLRTGAADASATCAFLRAGCGRLVLLRVQASGWRCFGRQLSWRCAQLRCGWRRNVAHGPCVFICMVLARHRTAYAYALATARAPRCCGGTTRTTPPGRRVRARGTVARLRYAWRLLRLPRSGAPRAAAVRRRAANAATISFCGTRRGQQGAARSALAAYRCCLLSGVKR